MSIYKKVLNDMADSASVVAIGLVELAFKLTAAIVVMAASLATYDGLASVFLDAGVPETAVPLLFVAWFFVLFNSIMKIVNRHVDMVHGKIRQHKIEEYKAEKYKKKPVENEVEAL